MPSKPKVPCKHPGCPELVPAGQKYCAKHKALHHEENRSAGMRGYNTRWRREAKRFLQVHPLCEECLKAGRAVPATVVDHIVPYRGDQKLFWDQTNWQALCKKCHDHKTRTKDQTPTYCEEHRKMVERNYERYSRDPDVHKKYGRAWRRIRDQYVKAHLFCEECFKRGILAPVDEVHHIVPVSIGGTNNPSNLMSLCKSCHNKIHHEMGD